MEIAHLRGAGVGVRQITPELGRATPSMIWRELFGNAERQTDPIVLLRPTGWRRRADVASAGAVLKSTRGC